MRRVLLPHAISPGPAPSGSGVHDYRGLSMGTSWSARVAHAGAAPHLPDDLHAGLQARLDDVVAQMSHWEPGSDLGRFNRAPAGTWQVLPPAFFHVLAYALDVWRDTAGACDPCAGALVNLWGFGPVNRYDEPGFTVPTAEQAQAALPVARVRLDPVSRSALQPGGVQLDLSAVAKGYGVDCLARWLEEQGVRDYLVEVGGELRGAGLKPDGQPWWVALEGVDDAPAGGDGIVAALHGLAVATSGDYRRYFLHDGQRRPHTIDPRSGMPIDNGLASVTVVDGSCMACDAWSTALTVLGLEDGLALAERRGIAARFVVRTDRGPVEHLSSHMRAMLEQA
ncbi:FAD:protein FMN transferase [Massilia dura]|uniref:FAD:protein FMN transferase n=1 Tax=Pseudoduganella dura TaxID=321982 RepID=A0A6I3XJY0_9BURK|nr:FAD:protein FMN transferase [Pseudoduganella dura]MUI14860.1 FAD:protein FMN transferase [Pseudoduganella dura]GGX85616.1 FAD:protein FMN transferase [Pseudoduganella dura]